MQITGMLHGSKLLEHVDFPATEVLGPAASEDEIQGLIDRHKLVFIKPVFKGGVGKKGKSGLIGKASDLKTALQEKERLYFVEHRHGNARAKAVYYSRHASGLLVLADDSGLEVDALGGRPGVRSARYADDLGYDLNSGAAIDKRNNALLMAKMERLPLAEPTARYHCVLALARNGEVLATADGSVEGRIVTSPRGEHGFGYDPIFLIPELGKTMAELDPATRLSLSHRGRALRSLLLQMPEG